MQKYLTFFFAFFFFSASHFFSYADDKVSPPIPISDQDMEKRLKAQEVILRKLKAEHLRQERREHRKETQQAYQEALEFYKQQRLGPAQQELKNVADLMADYKSTEKLLKITDKKATIELEKELRRVKDLDHSQMALDFQRKAIQLYEQTMKLENDKTTSAVHDKLGRLKESLLMMSQQFYLQQQLDGIAQKANGYDQDIFRLTQAGDLVAARKKFDEFQKVMINDLEKLQEKTQPQPKDLNAQLKMFAKQDFKNF